MNCEGVVKEVVSQAIRHWNFVKGSLVSPHFLLPPLGGWAWMMPSAAMSSVRRSGDWVSVQQVMQWKKHQHIPYPPVGCLIHLWLDLSTGWGILNVGGGSRCICLDLVKFPKLLFPKLFMICLSSHEYQRQHKIWATGMNLNMNQRTRMINF